MAMNDQPGGTLPPPPKWVGKSVTVLGLLGALAGVIWQNTDPAAIGVGVEAGQQILTYGGILAAAIGRLRKGGGAPLTMLPK